VIRHPATAAEAVQGSLLCRGHASSAAAAAAAAAAAVDSVRHGTAASLCSVPAAAAATHEHQILHLQTVLLQAGRHHSCHHCAYLLWQALC
jgi:imidazolonepropionase-like amidohydrolase